LYPEGKNKEEGRDLPRSREALTSPGEKLEEILLVPLSPFLGKRG
jgi:hypothetical protein